MVEAESGVVVLEVAIVDMSAVLGCQVLEDDCGSNYRVNNLTNFISCSLSFLH